MIWLDPPKGFSVDRHMNKVRAIARQLRIYKDKTLSEPLVEDMLVEVASHRHYRDTACLRTRLPAVLPMMREVMDVNAILRLAMFLLEHEHAFKSGKFISEWSGSPTLWVTGLVVDVLRDTSVKPGNSSRWRLRVLAMNGPPAGTVIETKVSTRYATYLPKMLGVPMRSPKNVMPEHAIGMVFFGQFGTIPSRSFALLEVKASSSMKTKNKQLFNRSNP